MKRCGFFQWVRSPPGNGSLQPEAIGAAVEVTKPPEPSDSGSRYRRLREWAGRNASERRAGLERRCGEPTRYPIREGRHDWGDERRAASVLRRGSGVSLYQGKGAQHGKPDGAAVVTSNRTTGDGQTGRDRVAERFVVPSKAGNAGGGKGPQFRADVESGEVLEIGQPLANSAKARARRPASQAEVKEGLAPWSGKRMSAQGVASAVVTVRR